MPIPLYDQPDIERDVERMKDVLLELQTAAYSHAQAYTTVVVFGAYAGLFTMWGFTREHLDQTITFTVGLLIGISLLAFVSHEIFSMIIRSREFFKMRGLFVQELTPAIFLAKRKKIAKEANIFVQWIVIPVWLVALSISAGTGIAAAIFLLYAFASALYAGLI